MDRLIIDWKFKFVATNPCKKSVYTEEDAMIFLAKDAAVPAMLEAYIQECRRLGCDNNHIEAASLMLDRVRKYHLEIENRIPDTNTSCEIDRCIGGILL